MGSRTVVGDSPVLEVILDVVGESRPGHEISWLKTGGPSSKAKYSLLTDSELVP